MFESKIENAVKKYNKLNEIAECGGVVVFGGKGDVNIPLGELCRAFRVETGVYNRSVDGISVKNASEVYDACVAVLEPETVLLHIGQEDKEYFENDRDGFEAKYCELVEHIRKSNKKCRIAVVTVKNCDEMNERLEYIAKKEKCEFANIERINTEFSLEAKQKTASFVCNLGFVNPLKTPQPIYDLVQILFCSTAA